LTTPLDTRHPGISNHLDSGEWLPVLSTLAAHPDGAIVANLAAELGASVSLVERRLHALKRQGLVTWSFEGTPPTVTWRCL
jgi:DNA-binding IclR family transcriptional regulator